AKLGDPVEITGTSSPQNLGNGVTVWTSTWDEWLVDSATGAVLTQVPSPTTDAGTDPTTDPNAAPDGTKGTPQPVPAVTTTPDAADVQQASYGR
ncbi:MAG: hypothetical protein NTX29_12070, partial [Actinobacteria bacterium]|nr:hypothetical protein [Actinomycetota bacterium]